jgi:nicotinamide mononucleotide adenylyltransferase
MEKVPFEEFIAAGMTRPTVKNWSPEQREKYVNIARRVWEESSPQKVQQLMTEIRSIKNSRTRDRNTP